MGFVNEKVVASMLEKQLGQKCISLENREISPEALKIVKQDIAEKYCILPLDFDNETLTIAMLDPTDLKTIDELSFLLGVRIKPTLAIESSIKASIAKHYTGVTSGGKKHVVNTSKLSKDMEIISYERPEHHISYPREIAVEALVEVLIEKGIITREELKNKLEKKIKRH
jgi:type II secretory ATPase GspE/PulE/Tfp pilus assembly ATPase PilB-like protein